VQWRLLPAVLSVAVIMLIIENIGRDEFDLWFVLFLVLIMGSSWIFIYTFIMTFFRKFTINKESKDCIYRCYCTHKFNLNKIFSVRERTVVHRVIRSQWVDDFFVDLSRGPSHKKIEIKTNSKEQSAELVKAIRHYKGGNDDE